MRGPLLSGPIGSASSLEALARSVRDGGCLVSIGPLWIAQVLSSRIPVLALVEPEERARARRVARRSAVAGHRLIIAIGGVDLPLAPASVGALLVESASALDVEAMRRWMAALVPTLRPGGRLIAVDATQDPSIEARLAEVFLAAALMEIVQERPRDGVVLTMGVAPASTVVAARFGIVGASRNAITGEG